MPNTSKPSLPKTSKPKASKSAPPHVLAAFAKFEEAKRALHLFRQQNQKVADAYDMHRDNYNAALTEVQSLYKQHWETLGPSYGGFTLHKKREINKELLLKLVPGITEALEYEYKLNVSIFEQLQADGLVDEDIAEQVLIEVPHQIRGATKL